MQSIAQTTTRYACAAEHSSGSFEPTIAPPESSSTTDTLTNVAANCTPKLPPGVR